MFTTGPEATNTHAATPTTQLIFVHSAPCMLCVPACLCWYHEGMQELESSIGHQQCHKKDLMLVPVQSTDVMTCI